MSRKHMTRMIWAAVAGMLVLVQTGLAAPPAAPEVSKFAPAEDLVGQIDEYLEELEESVEDEDEYNDSVEKLVKDANVLSLLGLAVGLHDTDNQYKSAAPAIVAAAQKVAATEDYASAKAAVAGVKAAVACKDATGCVEWNKVASLEPLMEAVPLLNSRLKRYMRRFDGGTEEVAAYSAILAVIAQGSMANCDETHPTDPEKWYAFCAQMRDAAALVNAAAHAEDEDAAEKAIETLAQSCDDCHSVFHDE